MLKGGRIWIWRHGTCPRLDLAGHPACQHEGVAQLYQPIIGTRLLGASDLLDGGCKAQPVPCYVKVRQLSRFVSSCKNLVQLDAWSRSRTRLGHGAAPTWYLNHAHHTRPCCWQETGLIHHIHPCTCTSPAPC